MTHTELRHGASRYTNNHCRCEACTEGHRQAIRDRRTRRRALRVLVDGRLVCPVAEVVHGTANTYINWGCRCPSCTDASSRLRSRQRRSVS